MKKKMPLICTMIFLLGIFVWSGIIIEANESNIKFSNLYGERSQLENVQFNLAKTKGIRNEDLIINSKEIKSETSFAESRFNSIYSGFDVLDDKKFFRGLFITPETFYEDNDVKVDVTDKSYINNPHFKVRIKYKKTNTYEDFQVENKTNLNQDYRINGISYKNGKINILFMKNSSKDTMVIFGEIDINSKAFEISEPINLNEELDIIGLDVKVSYLKNTPSKVIIDDKLFWLYEISNSLVVVGFFLLMVMLSQMSVETYRGRELTFNVPTKNKVIFLISGLPGVIGTFLSFYYGFITLKYNGLGFTSGTLI